MDQRHFGGGTGHIHLGAHRDYWEQAPLDWFLSAIAQVPVEERPLAFCRMFLIHTNGRMYERVDADQQSTWVQLLDDALVTLAYHPKVAGARRSNSEMWTQGLLKARRTLWLEHGASELPVARFSLRAHQYIEALTKFFRLRHVDTEWFPGGAWTNQHMAKWKMVSDLHPSPVARDMARHYARVRLPLHPRAVEGG